MVIFWMDFQEPSTQVENLKMALTYSFILKISDKEALWRISGRTEVREDETLMAIRKRIASFHKFTDPVIEHYRQKGILIEIDGEQSIEEITQTNLKSSQ